MTWEGVTAGGGAAGEAGCCTVPAGGAGCGGAVQGGGRQGQAGGGGGAGARPGVAGGEGRAAAGRPGEPPISGVDLSEKTVTMCVVKARPDLHKCKPGRLSVGQAA